MSLAEQRFVHEAAGLFDRSARGVLDLSGSNVVKVMHGVFSSSVASLAAGQGQMSALLSAKGRLIASFQLHLIDGPALRLIFLEPLRDAVVKAIHKYAFLSDISLTDRTAELGLLSVEGAQAGRAMREAAPGARLPERLLETQVLDFAGRKLVAVRAGASPEGGYELWVPRGELEAISGLLARSVASTGGGVVGAEAAEALRIEAGIPLAGKDYDDESFPNDVGLESSLTYDKCYVGQEIVARMRTYGQANRRLLGLLLPGDRLPPLPFVLRAGGEEAGRVGSAAVSARLGRAIALASVKRKHWEAKRAEIDTPEGPLLADVVGLPFAPPA